MRTRILASCALVVLGIWLLCDGREVLASSSSMCQRASSRHWRCRLPKGAAIPPSRFVQTGWYTLLVYAPRWCAPCRTLKQRYPQMLRRFGNLQVVHVETARRPGALTAAMVALAFPRKRYPRMGFPLYFLFDPFGLVAYKGFGVGAHLKALEGRLAKRKIQRFVPFRRAGKGKRRHLLTRTSATLSSEVKGSPSSALDGVVSAPVQRPQVDGKGRWYRSGWFWFGMVSAAAAVATTTALVVHSRHLQAALDAKPKVP